MQLYKLKKNSKKYPKTFSSQFLALSPLCIILIMNYETFSVFPLKVPIKPPKYFLKKQTKNNKKPFQKENIKEKN